MTRLRVKRPITKSRQKIVARRKGQAAIEVVLLTAVVTLIFGYMFASVRQSVFRLWVCDMTPRIQSAAGCDFESRACYAEASEQTATIGICQGLMP